MAWSEGGFTFSIGVCFFAKELDKQAVGGVKLGLYTLAAQKKTPLRASNSC